MYTRLLTIYLNATVPPVGNVLCPFLNLINDKDITCIICRFHLVLIGTEKCPTQSIEDVNALLANPARL